MKYVFSIFLVITMAASVIVPLVVQWRGESMYQLFEDNKDESKDELKVEKEKEIYTYHSLVFIKLDSLLLEDSKTTLYYKHDKLISEYHAFLPEIPPKA